MSYTVTTDVDEEAKQKFNKICQRNGVSDSNALGMFIHSVNYNEELPISIMIPRQMSPKKKNKKAEMGNRVRGQFNISDDYEAELDEFNGPNVKKLSREESFDSAPGKFNIPDDFNEPLEDFKDYM